MTAATLPRAAPALKRRDRERTMVTPEGISLGITLASRGARAGALVLDLLFIGGLMLGTTLGLIFLAGGVAETIARLESVEPFKRAMEFLLVVWIAAMFLFRNAYFLFFELGARGATPGKRLAGIRVAARASDGGGRRLSAEMVIARNLLRDIELFLPLVFLASASSGDGGAMGAASFAGAAWFLVFMLFPFFNRDRLRAGDLIAGTWVVEVPRRKLEVALSSPAAEPSPAAVAYSFSDEELSVYGEYELQTLERVLRDRRPEAMQSVYETICGKIGWQPGDDAPAFLDAYYQQLRARLEGEMRMGRRKADKFA